MLTLGEFRRRTAQCSDDLPIEINGSNIALNAEQIDVEIDGDADGAWISINVKD